MNRCSTKIVMVSLEFCGFCQGFVFWFFISDGLLFMLFLYFCVYVLFVPGVHMLESLSQCKLSPHLFFLAFLLLNLTSFVSYPLISAHCVSHLFSPSLITLCIYCLSLPLPFVMSSLKFVCMQFVYSCSTPCMI